MESNDTKAALLKSPFCAAEIDDGVMMALESWMVPPKAVFTFALRRHPGEDRVVIVMRGVSGYEVHPDLLDMLSAHARALQSDYNEGLIYV